MDEESPDEFEIERRDSPILTSSVCCLLVKGPYKTLELHVILIPQPMIFFQGPGHVQSATFH